MSSLSGIRTTFIFVFLSRVFLNTALDIRRHTPAILAPQAEQRLQALRMRDSLLHPKIQKFIKELEAKKAPIDLDGEDAIEKRPLALQQTTDELIADPGSVHFTVYSDSQFYDTRLTWVRDTWASTISKSSVDVISDAPAGDEFGLKVHTTSCPPHSHWEGACCKYAEAVIQAHEVMQSNSSVQWAYFTDDDAYVRPQELAQSLVSRTPTASDQPLILANLGCVTKNCTGMCAGGGYVASRAAIKALVGSSPADFLREQMASCSQCERWADIALSTVAQNRGIQFEAHAGLNGWRLTNEQFQASLRAEPAEPLMYHYIQKKGEMQFLHDLFNGKQGSAASLQESGSTRCATYHETTVCTDDAAPWT